MDEVIWRILSVGSDTTGACPTQRPSDADTGTADEIRSQGEESVRACGGVGWNRRDTCVVAGLT
jgi:hypothetical protein